MRAGRPLLLAAVLLLALAPQGEACSVPCGYVYPRLLFGLGERGAQYELTLAQPLELRGNLTFTWDITAEGMAVQNPTVPIVVSFSFPRKPSWLQAEVEPAQLEIPISPQFVETTPTANGVQAVYRYTADFVVRARLNATPEVDPEAPPSLLILAQSTESGLYKPGFGVRDLALGLPEARLKAGEALAPQELRVGDPVPLALPELALDWQGATLRLEASGPIELWTPAQLTARVQGAGGAARAVDMAASVVDEDNELLYTTGLRHAPDGALPFTYTFPEPGSFRVLVAARPVAGASDVAFEPVAVPFEVLVPGTEWDALRYPDAYRASYLEPTSELHANPQDLPRQYEKLLRFPVLGGAESASVQVQLGSTAGAALGAGSVYVEVLGPAGEQLGYGKLDPAQPVMDARLRGPLAGGDYGVRLYGTGANPLGLAGTTLQVTLGVFYDEPPVGRVTTRGAPEPAVGGPVALGTGGMLLDLLFHEEPALWTPVHATLVANTEAGATALHPDFILTVMGPARAGGAPQVLYTTGHRHPHDGVLDWGMAFPAPGLYTINAYAGPTPEASGAFWQPAVASWPVRIAAPEDGLVRYPAQYAASYHDSTSTVRADGYAEGAPFEKRYPVPVLAGAQRLTAELALSTMAMVEHVEGAAPAALTLELLDPEGAVLATAQATLAGGAGLESAELAAPGVYELRVRGVGYAPLDYSGAMYMLDVAVDYAEAPVEALPGFVPPAAQGAPEPRALPGFEATLLGLALLAVAGLRRRR